VSRSANCSRPDDVALQNLMNATYWTIQRNNNLHSPFIWKGTSRRCRDQMQGASLGVRTAVATSSQNVDAWTNKGKPLCSGACSLNSQGVWALVTAQVVVDPAPLVHCTATCQPVLDAAMLCRTWFEKLSILQNNLNISSGRYRSVLFWVLQSSYCCQAHAHRTALHLQS
jgi:hypothetical protein